MRGGKRQGAGRKKGFSAKNAEEARKLLSQMVLDEIEPIGRALINKAKKGDIQACKELFDRAWGRARQEVLPVHSNESVGRVIYLPQRDQVVRIAKRVLEEEEEKLAQEKRL